MHKFISILLLVLIFLVSRESPALAENNEIRDILFPTKKDFSFEDSFGNPRYGHDHEGIDIMGEQMAPLYAAVDGVISYITIPEASWGYHLVIKDSEGYTYHYLHINNDTPGSDDGQGGIENAYAPGMKRGVKVEMGQLVGYMGDSGNAENVGNHLHFEIRRPDDTPINAYESLVLALNKDLDNLGGIIETSSSINDDLGLSTLEEKPEKKLCESGSLIKMADYSTVYYCGADSKRYVFPNEKIFYSWYDDFDDALIISVEQMESIPLGGNVRYKPGERMIKTISSSKVYAVEKGGRLRWVQSANVAESLYGKEWNQKIDDLSESFFIDYHISEAISLIST